MKVKTGTGAGFRGGVGEAFRSSTCSCIGKPLGGPRRKANSTWPSGVCVGFSGPRVGAPARLANVLALYHRPTIFSADGSWLPRSNMIMVRFLDGAAVSLGESAGLKCANP